VNAVGEETIEPPGGNDAGHIAIPEAQLVIGRFELRPRDSRGARAGVVEGADLRQDVAVHDRDATRPVTDAQITGPEVLRARRGQDEKRGYCKEAKKQRSHDASNTPLRGSKVPTLIRPLAFCPNGTTVAGVLLRSTFRPTSACGLGELQRAHPTARLRRRLDRVHALPCERRRR